MQRSFAAALCSALLAVPSTAALAQPGDATAEAFELYGCGTASCHTLRGVVLAGPAASPANRQYFVSIDYVAHTFFQPGYMFDHANGGGVFGTLPDGTTTGAWTELVGGCGFQPSGSTCTPGGSGGAGFYVPGHSYSPIMPMGLRITGGYTQVVLLPSSYSAAPGTYLRPGGITGVPGERVETVALALVTPEPGTWALLGTGLLALGGVAARRTRAV